MDACLHDNVKARELHADGGYTHVQSGGERTDAQQLQMDLALAAQAEPEPAPERTGVLSKLINLMQK